MKTSDVIFFYLAFEEATYVGVMAPGLVSAFGRKLEGIMLII